MSVKVSANALQLQIVILNYCEYFKSVSIYPGRVKLLEGFNNFTHRSVSLSSLDRYIRQLKDGLLLKRWPRKKDCGSLGLRFTSAGSSITKKGLKALEWVGIKAFAVMDKIKACRAPRKKRAHPKDVERAPASSFAPLGTTTNELVRKLKPS